MYCESLEANVKQRYCEKLSCVGLPIHNDRYLTWRRRGLLARVQSQPMQFTTSPILGYHPRCTNSVICWRRGDFLQLFQQGLLLSVPLASIWSLASRNLYLVASYRIAYFLRSETCYQLMYICWAHKWHKFFQFLLNTQAVSIRKGLFFSLLQLV